MVNVNDVYQSKYLKASDLQDEERTLVIDSADVEEVGDDRKIVVYFQHMKKGLVLNRTNADRICHLYGPNTDDWIGREITLFSDMANFQGRTVDALRVKAASRKSKPANTPTRQTGAGSYPADRITTGPQRTHAPLNEPPPWEPEA